MSAEAQAIASGSWQEAARGADSAVTVTCSMRFDWIIQATGWTDAGELRQTVPALQVVTVALEAGQSLYVRAVGGSTFSVSGANNDGFPGYTLPDEKLSLALDPAQPAPGDTVTITAAATGGAAQITRFDAYLSGHPLRAAGSGDTRTVTLPPDTRDGEYLGVSAEALVDGRVCRASIVVRIAASTTALTPLTLALSINLGAGEVGDQFTITGAVSGNAGPVTGFEAIFASVDGRPQPFTPGDDLERTFSAIQPGPGEVFAAVRDGKRIATAREYFTVQGDGPAPQPVAPTFTAPPVIGGSLTVGGIATFSAGSVTGTAPITIEMRLRESTATVGSGIVVGENRAWAEVDAEKSWAIDVTATNAIGSATATSQAVGPVQSGGATSLSISNNGEYFSIEVPEGDFVVTVGGIEYALNTSDILGKTPALLHKSAEVGGSPFPERTYALGSVTGSPSAVKPFRTATRTWNSAT